MIGWQGKGEDLYKYCYIMKWRGEVMIVNMCTMNQSYRTILMGQLKNLKFDKYLCFGLFFHNPLSCIIIFNLFTISTQIQLMQCFKAPFSAMFPARSTLKLRQYEKSKVNDRFIVIALNVYSRIKPRSNGFSSINHYLISISSKSFLFLNALFNELLNRDT